MIDIASIFLVLASRLLFSCQTGHGTKRTVQEGKITIGRHLRSSTIYGRPGPLFLCQGTTSGTTCVVPSPFTLVVHTFSIPGGCLLGYSCAILEVHKIA